MVLLHLLYRNISKGIQTAQPEQAAKVIAQFPLGEVPLSRQFFPIKQPIPGTPYQVQYANYQLLPNFFKNHKKWLLKKKTCVTSWDHLL